jgi:hypothetical protein
VTDRPGADAGRGSRALDAARPGPQNRGMARSGAPGIGRTAGRVAAVPVAAVFLALTLVGCGSGSRDDGTPTRTGEPGASSAADQAFPRILGVRAEREPAGTWSFAVTISSPYDTPERYASGWRVLDPAGAVLGEHRLAHDHAGEQPFTRVQSGVEVPPGVDAVRVEAADLVNGYGGDVATVPLDGS